MSPSKFKKTLLIIGAGNMGEAMLKSWVQPQTNQISLFVLEPSPSDWLKSVFGKGLLELNPRKIPNEIDICVLAVKPQKLGEVLEENQSKICKNTLIVSVVAGKDFQFFQSYFGKDQSIIRVMPNTPVSVNRGVSAIVADEYARETQIELVKELFAPLGEVVLLDKESEIDVVTAISGSGPAYVFNFIENLIEMAEELGLSRQVSKKLVISTVVGAGILAAGSTLSPRRLRENVTSPAGTTQAALEILMDNQSGWKPIIKNAVKAAYKRSREIAGKKNQ